MILLVFLGPLSSFKPIKHSNSTGTVKHFTTTEFGEFEHNGTVYGVYGDASTNTITSITVFWTGVPVYSWSGTYSSTGWPLPHGSQPYVSVIVKETSTSTQFSYTGTLLFY